MSEEDKLKLIKEIEETINQNPTQLIVKLVQRITELEAQLEEKKTGIPELAELGETRRFIS